MGRKSARELPPGIHLDQHGVFWATLEGDEAKTWRKRYPGKSLPRRKAADLRAAIKLQRGLIDDLSKGNDPNAENPKVAAWVETCINRKRKLADSTARRYRQSLKWQIEPSTLGRMRVRQVQKKQVEAWIDGLITQRPQGNSGGEVLNPHSIRNAFALLRMAFNIAVVDGLIPKNPCAGVELPRPEDEEIHPLTAEQVGMLFTLLDTHDKGKRHRNAALYHVAIRCGLRQAELLGLRWKDVDLERRVLHVAGQLKDKAHAARGKTRRARRTVPLSADTVDAVRWHKQNQAEEKAISQAGWNAAGLVFVSENGTPLGHSNVDRQFDALLRRAGVPDIRFHAMRHTYAALSIAAGVDIYTLSRRMGHSSISVTADRYGHLYQGNNQDADSLDRLLKRA